MAILDTLAREHRDIEKIIARLADLPSTKPELRLKTFSRFQTLLQAHARAEEEVVYRRLKQRGADEQKTLEAYEEHHIADILLQELASACPGGHAWAAKVKVLEELLRHHIKEEELNLFPLVEESFEPATRERMDREFAAVRHERLETLLGPFRRLTPAFAGRAVISVQAMSGRLLRRAELAAMRISSRAFAAGARRRPARPRPGAHVEDIATMAARGSLQRDKARAGNGASMQH